LEFKIMHTYGDKTAVSNLSIGQVSRTVIKPNP
jgi:hypothetical protein